MNVSDIKTLVCSGGGINGLAYVGVLRAFQEMDEVKVDAIACVSAGAIFALCYILKVDAKELDKQLIERDLQDFLNIKVNSLFTKFGLDTGSKIIVWLQELLESKGVKKDISLLDFYNLTQIHLMVYTTNLSTYERCVLDYITAPNLSVVKAIRMSMSVPFIFTTKKYKNQLYVDGALSDNFPLQLYPKESTLGIKITNTFCQEKSITSIENFSYSIVNCFFKNIEDLKTIQYTNNYINIVVDGVGAALDFNMEKNEKKRLVDLGYKTVVSFMSDKFKIITNNKSE
jgi:NTE family protein